VWRRVAQHGVEDAMRRRRTYVFLSHGARCGEEDEI
jgi:hypothetical protein